MRFRKPPSARGPTSTASPTRRWPEKESEKLFEAVKQHGSNWNAVARLVPGRDKSECQARWTAELDAARAATKIGVQPPQATQGEAPPQMLPKYEDIIVPKRPRFDSRKVKKAADIAVAKKARFDSRKRKKDEVIPAAKKPRSYSPVYTPADVVAASQMMETAAAASQTDWVVVASTCSPTAASLEQPLGMWNPAEEDAELTESRTGKWRLEEDALLTEAVKKYGTNWIAVATMVPGRTDSQCYTKWVKSLEPSNRATVRTAGILTAAADAELAEGAEILSKGFVAVAELVPVPVPADALIANGDPAIADNKLGRWTSEEDTKLIAAVAALEKLGKKEWTEVARLVPGRTNNQCRIRWVMQLDPSGGPNTVEMGSWTEDEYVELVGAVKRHGSKLVSGRKNWSKELRLAVAATNPNISSLQQQSLDSPQDEAPPQQLQQAGDTQVSKRPRFETPIFTAAAHVVVAAPVTATKKIPSHNDVASTASATVAFHAQSPSVTGPTASTRIWTEEENEKLFEAVKQHGSNWNAVARLVPGRDKSECHARWTAELDAARAVAKLYASPPGRPRQEPRPPQYEAPPQMLQQDEDIPAAKRPRFETSRPIAEVEVVDLSTADTVATTSCNDRVVVASTSSAVVASDAQPRNWWRWWQQK
jgi:hypothetical protein